MAPDDFERETRELERSVPGGCFCTLRRGVDSARRRCCHVRAYRRSCVNNARSKGRHSYGSARAKRADDLPGVPSEITRGRAV
jgi:hypothetical protein